MKKHLVIFAGDIYPNPSPNGVCIKNLISGWQDVFDITIIAYNQDNGPKYRTENGINYIYINSLSTYIQNAMRKKSAFTGKIADKLMRVWRGVKTSLLWLRYDGYYYKGCLRETAKLNKEKRVDCIIAACYPFSAIYAAFVCKQKYNIDYITYILDVYSNAGNLRKFCFFKKLYERKDRNQELNILKNAKTNFLSEGFLNADVYKDVTEEKIKHKIVGFPIIRNKRNDSAQEKVEKINLFYGGTFVKGVREPFGLMNFFSETIPDIKLTLCTTGDYQEIIYNWAKDLPNVEFLGTVDRATAEERKNKSDILINVSNLNAHQIPSKIFEYFQSGKPVINFYSEASFNKLFDKYPLVLHIPQDGNNQEFLRDFYIFCNTYKHSRVPLQDVLDSYKEYSVEYLKGIFIEEINRQE